MKNTARFSLASLSLLGSLAALACSDSGGSDTPNSFTPPAPTTETPAPPVTDTNTQPEPPPATDGVPTDNATDGVIDPTGGVTGTPPTTPTKTARP